MNYFEENGNIIGNIYKIEKNNDRKYLNENNSNSRHTNKYYELLINLYLFQTEIKDKINKPINKLAKSEEYILVNGKWMEQLLKFIEYENFVKDLEKNNIDDIIIQYKNQTGNLIDKIKLLIPSCNMNYLDSKEKSK